MNEIAKFLKGHARHVPPEIVEDYYRYCSSILVPETRPLPAEDCQNAITTERYEQDNIGK